MKMDINILNLADDCLYLIFRKLETKDQFALTETCSRFMQVIVNMIWNTKYAEVYTWHPELLLLTKDEYKRFIKLIAKNVRKLRLAIIDIWPYTGGGEQDISFNFQFEFIRLEEFDCEDGNLNDEHIRLLVENSPRIHTIRLDGYRLTGKSLALLSNLRRLDLGYVQLDTNCLSELLRFDRLKTLAIAGVFKIDLGEVLRMTSDVDALVNLQELYIAASHITPKLVKYFYMLCNLQLLEVHVVNQNFESCCFELANKLAPQIHGLRINQKSHYAPAKFDKVPIVDILYELNILKNIKELYIEDIFNLNDTLPMIVNSLNLQCIHVHVNFLKRAILRNWLVALVFQLEKQTKQINRPTITVNLVEHSPGASKAYCDAVQSVSGVQKFMKFMTTLGGKGSRPNFAVDNCVGFELKSF